MAKGTNLGTADGAVSAGQPPEMRRWTLERQAAFLGHLAATCNVRGSAHAVGMSEQGVHKLRLRSPEFRAAWETAIEEGYVRLELMLIQRAINGVEKPLIRNGKKVGSTTEYSDRLALGLLSARRPATHRAVRPVETERDRAEVRRLIEAKLSEMNRAMGGNG